MEQGLTPTASHFNKQIEALRGIGALIVILDHWALLLPEPYNRSISKFNPGLFGIAIFFLISGYYITDLILRTKASENPNWLKKYFVQRAFRLFPVYYFSILLFTILLTEMRGVWEIHTFFLGNFYPFMTNKGISIGDHFWSVGAELHFYILWPFLLLTIPKQYYKILAICIMLCGPLTRYVILQLYPGGHHSLGVFTLVIFDWIGMGAFFAFCEREGLAKLKDSIMNVLLFLTPLSVFTYVYCYLNYRRTVFFTTIEYLLSGIVFGLLVFRAATGKNGVLEKLYTRSWLIWLGSVSYTFYILHPFIPIFVERYITEPLVLGEENILLISTILLIALTIFVHRLIELPFRAIGKKI